MDSSTYDVLMLVLTLVGLVLGGLALSATAGIAIGAAAGGLLVGLGLTASGEKPSERRPGSGTCARPAHYEPRCGDRAASQQRASTPTSELVG